MKLLQQEACWYRYFVALLSIVAENVATDRHTDLQTKYHNPCCTCSPRVNEGDVCIDASDADTDLMH